MRFGSLFTGIGGFDLGFERAGMDCVWQVEIDAACQDVERRHWPNVKRFGDVQNVGKASLDSVDLICGGFPCQDVSVAGKREGLAGERSGLWFEFHRILKELKPQWVVVENVPGLLSSEGGRDFAAILRGLVELRYGVAWRILDAQYFGVAQRRRRVFIVGSLGDGRAAQVLFERESGAGDTPPSREEGARLATDIAASLKGGSGQRGFPIEWEAGLTTVAWDNGQGDPNADDDGTAFALNGQTNQGVAFQQNTRDEVRLMGGDGAIAGALSSEAGMKQQNYIAFKKRGGFGWSEDKSIAQTLESEGGTHQGGPERVPLVVSRDAVPKTASNLVTDLRSGNPHISAVLTFPGMAQSGAGWAPPSMPIDEDKSGPLDTKRAQCVSAELIAVRRLTPTECERLQGFPDGWTMGQSDSVRYRQLGNAVCEPVAEWIGKRLKEIAHHA